MKSGVSVAVAVLVGLSSGCALVPHYAAVAEGSAAVQATVGVDLIAAHSEAGGALVIYLQKEENGPYVEQWRTDLQPGAAWYRRIEWGRNPGGGWIKLVPVSCEEARAEYPWLPACTASMRSMPRGEVQESSMYVGHRAR